MRISDWSSDVCSSDLSNLRQSQTYLRITNREKFARDRHPDNLPSHRRRHEITARCPHIFRLLRITSGSSNIGNRSEEHTSDLQSLMRISYAVFCLKKKKQQTTNHSK